MSSSEINLIPVVQHLPNYMEVTLIAEDQGHLWGSPCPPGTAVAKSLQQMWDCHPDVLGMVVSVFAPLVLVGDGLR